jgi:hypothetical protein
MRKLMKLLHYVVLILFLGSILSYILISALAKGSTPPTSSSRSKSSMLA